MKKIVKNSLGFDQKLFVYQNKTMFNYSIDTILLGNFVTLNHQVDYVLEIGTNNGALAIFLASRHDKLKIDAIEIQKEALDLASKNVVANCKENQINLIEGDFNDFYQSNKSNQNKYDLIVVNPPFYKVGKTNFGDASFQKLIATHEIKINLEQIVLGASLLLRKKGYLSLVVATERFVDLCCLLRKYKFEVKRVQFIHPRVNQKSNLTLVEGRFQSGWGTHFLPNLYLHPRKKTAHNYRQEIKKLYLPILVKRG